MKTLIASVLIVLLGLSAAGGYSFGKHRGPKPEKSSPVVVPEHAPPLPEYITIRGESWALVPADLGGEQGQTGCKERIIWYSPKDQGTLEDFRDTLWHEITHAAFNCQTKFSSNGAWWDKGANSEDTHEKVWQLSQFLPGFVHDNPEFMKWAEDWK